MTKIYTLVVTTLNEENEIESTTAQSFNSLTLAKAQLTVDYFKQLEDIQGDEDETFVYHFLDTNECKDTEYEIGVDGMFYIKGQIIENELK